MIIKARVMTRPKANTLDPQGVVVKKNLERIGVNYLKKVSIGRYIEIELEDASDEEIKQKLTFEALNMVLLKGGKIKCYEPQDMSIIEIDCMKDLNNENFNIK